ncbi:MAG TPA: hypothetical protein VIA63_01530 [Candidatus Limnocylindria bacterium]
MQLRAQTLGQRPQRDVDVRRAQQAKRVEQKDGLVLATLCLLRAQALVPGHLGRNDGGDKKDEQREPLLWVLDRELVERFGEEEVIDDEGKERGHNRGSASKARRRPEDDDDVQRRHLRDLAAAQDERDHDAHREHADDCVAVPKCGCDEATPGDPKRSGPLLGPTAQPNHEHIDDQGNSRTSAGPLARSTGNQRCSGLTHSLHKHSIAQSRFFAASRWFGERVAHLRSHRSADACLQDPRSC